MISIFSKRAALASLTGIIIWAMISCASKLPTDKKINRPEGSVLAVDLSLVNFLDINSGETVNLKAYMEANNRDHMLLTFGSRGCVACNEKGFVLRDSVIGQHPIFLTEEGKRFEVMGINTDPESLARIKQFVLSLQFQSFLKWNDPRGKGMIEHFMPAGRAFGVPLTVMINRKGIKWAITNDEGLHVEEIMAKVEKTLLGGDALPNPGKPDPKPTSTPIVLPSRTELDIEAPGRLRSVKVTTCEGEAKDLAEVLSVHDYYVVQAEGTTCGEACASNRAQMTALKGACNADDGTGCGVISLSGSSNALDSPSASPVDRQACSDGVLARGGSELFTSFYHHFSWNNRVIETFDPDWALSLEPDTGPLFFIFGKDGKLVYSKEGKLGESELANVVGNLDFGKRARGPDFEFYGKGVGSFYLGDIRQKSKYTVVNAYGTFCGSCIEEMKFWSQPGELKDFCASRPTDCQVQLVNTDYPGDGQTFDQFLDEADGILKPNGISFPLALDPINPDDNNGYLRRFFSGYLIAEFYALITNKDHRIDPRSVIYDQEGRILGMYRAEGVKPHNPQDPNSKPHVDPVLKRLRELLEAK